MHEHTYESLVELHCQKSGRSNHTFNSHEVECIARLQGDHGQPLLALEAPTLKLLGAVVEEFSAEYIWKLAAVPSEVMRRGKAAAAKFRATPGHRSLMATLNEADVRVSKDRRRILTAIANATTVNEAIDALGDLIAE